MDSSSAVEFELNPSSERAVDLAFRPQLIKSFWLWSAGEDNKLKSPLTMRKF